MRRYVPIESRITPSFVNHISPVVGGLSPTGNLTRHPFLSSRPCPAPEDSATTNHLAPCSPRGTPPDRRPCEPCGNQESGRCLILRHRLAGISRSLSGKLKVWSDRLRRTPRRRNSYTPSITRHHDFRDGLAIAAPDYCPERRQPHCRRALLSKRHQGPVMLSLRSLSRSTVTDASGFHTRPWRGVDQQTLTGPTQTSRKWRSRLHGRRRLARHSCSLEWRRAAPRLPASNPADPQSQSLIRPFAPKSCSRGDEMTVTAPALPALRTSIECGVLHQVDAERLATRPSPRP